MKKVIPYRKKSNQNSSKTKYLTIRYHRKNNNKFQQVKTVPPTIHNKHNHRCIMTIINPITYLTSILLTSSGISYVTFLLYIPQYSTHHNQLQFLLSPFNSNFSTLIFLLSSSLTTTSPSIEVK